MTIHFEEDDKAHIVERVDADNVALKVLILVLMVESSYDLLHQRSHIALGEVTRRSSRINKDLPDD